MITNQDGSVSLSSIEWSMILGFLQSDAITIAADNAKLIEDKAQIDTLIAEVAALKLPPPPPIYTAMVIFHDDFSTGDLSKKRNGKQFWTNNSSDAEMPGSDGPSTVMVRQSQDGTHSCVFHYAGAPLPSGANAELEFDLGENFTEVWVESTYFFPTNYWRRQNNPGNNKFFIIDNLEKSNFIDFETFPDWEHFGPGVDVGNIQLKYDHVNHDFQKYGPNDYSTWQFVAPEDRGNIVKYLLHVKLATSATSNDGAAQVWKNGELVRSFTDFPNYSPGSNWMRTGYMGGTANSGFDKNTDIELREVTFYSTNPMS